MFIFCAMMYYQPLSQQLEKIINILKNLNFEIYGSQNIYQIDLLAKTAKWSGNYIENQEIA